MWGYIFLLPWIVGLLFVFLMPLILSVVFSFSKITVDNGYVSTFIGFENYKTALLSDENFPQYLAESLKNILLDVPVILVFSFFVAILLKEKFHGNALAKFVFFIPVIMASGLFLQLQRDVYKRQALYSVQQVLRGFHWTFLFCGYNIGPKRELLRLGR